MAIRSSQTTDYFEDDQEDFNDALMQLEVEAPATKAESPASPLRQKRKHEETEQDVESGLDVNLHALATMRQKPDKTDIYGASSFGNYGEYMARKRAKLQIQNAQMAKKKSTIFEGIEIYINGRVEPSLQELREMIVEHGGIFHAYLTKKTLVTHILAMNLTPAKVKEFARMKVARPAWIVESVKAGFLLPWNDFKLVIDERADSAQGQRSGQTFLRPVQPKPKGGEPASPIKDPLYMTDPVTMEQAARIPSYALNKSNTVAQRLMAQPGWREENTATSGTKFINNYYENSRLHHLSMWKAELKDLVSKAREQNDNVGDSVTTDPDAPEVARQMGHGVSMKGAELLKTWEAFSPSKKGKETNQPIVQRVYMHCDFDSFFVSASLLAHPEHRGKPVVVCHSQGSGEGVASTSEVASSSYEARAAGIHNGMSLGQARQLCPGVLTLPYEFEMYKELSLKFYTILLSFTDELQAVSVDEALLDVSHAVANLKVQTLSQDPSAITADFAKVLAEQIRARLLEVTQCQVSVGIGENLLLARIASRKAKPAGSYHLLASGAEQFLSPLPLDMIWGVGYATKVKAEEKLQIKTIGDILPKSKPSLVKVFGPAMADKLYKAARGLDDSKLQLDQKRKSVSAEINFGIRFDTNDQAALFTRKLGQEVASRLQAIEMKGRLLTLKVMKRHPEAPIEAPKFMGHGICEQFSKSAALADPSSINGATNTGDIIGDLAWNLLDSLQFDPRELRGLGLQVTKLEGRDGPVTESETKLQNGQTKLSFPVSPGKAVKSAGDDALDTKEGDAVNNLTTPSSFERPTTETLDHSILDELPAEIREEILEQLKGSANNDTSTLGRKEDQTARIVHPVEEGDDDIVEISAPSKKGFETPRAWPQATENPSTSKTPTKSVGHITRQLRPKTKTIISPTKIALFTKQREAFQTSEEELRELGLDAEVFFNLPKDLQREQLAHQRESGRKRTNALKGVGEWHGGAHTPGMTRAAGFGFDQSRGRFTRSPSLGPRAAGSEVKLEAKFPEPVVLNLASRPAQAVISNEKGKERAGPPLNLVNVTDIQAHLKRWVMTCQKAKLGPAQADIEALQSWLIKCLKIDGSGTGIEKATIVMKWWRELLRGCWGENQTTEKMKVEEGENLHMAESAGDSWWKAFWDIKAEMDAVVKDMMGGKLSLK